MVNFDLRGMGTPWFLVAIETETFNLLSTCWKSLFPLRAAGESTSVLKVTNYHIACLSKKTRKVREAYHHIEARGKLILLWNIFPVMVPTNITRKLLCRTILTPLSQPKHLWTLSCLTGLFSLFSFTSNVKVRNKLQYYVLHWCLSPSPFLFWTPGVSWEKIRWFCLTSAHPDLSPS